MSNPTKEQCTWTFQSSPMGVQGGYWWQTSCGHRASGVRQPPHRCDYCHHLVTDVDHRRNAQTASVSGGSPARPTGEMNGGAMCQQRQSPDEPNPSSNLVTQLEAWIRSDKGRIYACGRDYPGVWREPDPTCECCLMIAAVRALSVKPSPAETSAPLGTICYSPCDKHKGMSWTMFVRTSPAAVIRSVCPICEPPPSPEKVPAPQRKVAYNSNGDAYLVDSPEPT